MHSCARKTKLEPPFVACLQHVQDRKVRQNRLQCNSSNALPYCEVLQDQWEIRVIKKIINLSYQIRGKSRMILSKHICAI